MRTNYHIMTYWDLCVWLSRNQLLCFLYCCIFLPRWQTSAWPNLSFTQAWRQCPGQPVSPSDFLTNWLTPKWTRRGCSLRTNVDTNYSSYINPGDDSASTHISQHPTFQTNDNTTLQSHPFTFFRVVFHFFAQVSNSINDDEVDDNHINQVLPCLNVVICVSVVCGLQLA